MLCLIAACGKGAPENPDPNEGIVPFPTANGGAGGAPPDATAPAAGAMGGGAGGASGAAGAAGASGAGGQGGVGGTAGADAGLEDTECEPGEKRSCYLGPDGTEDVGDCAAGERTCKDDGSGFGSCQGQVLPAEDDCEGGDDEDCNGTDDDGDDCECEPGDKVDCYTGSNATRGVGECQDGERTCRDDGEGYGPCTGQVLPRAPECGGGDRDCNDVDDDEQDEDEDGWGLCDDCCDDDSDCDDPELVNPGAFDWPDDDVDDDCSGEADDSDACDGAIASDTTDSVDHARAIELCNTTTEAPADDADKTWGVLSATFTGASGTGTPNAAQRAVRDGFGAIMPQGGSRMTVLSTGPAADSNDPGFVTFQLGTDYSSPTTFPADWYEANGNQLPNAPGCPAPTTTGSGDSAMLTFTVRAPTNANGFRVRAYFLSAEFPEYVCSPFNDFFVALLDSEFDGTPANPDDGNIAVYSPSEGVAYPVGVNLAYGNTGLFAACSNGTIGCAAGATSGTINTCVSADDLAGTGFETAISASNVPAPCGPTDQVGGGTGWLQLTGNVVPGETFTLRLAIWDTGDRIYDSVVLLDGFEWLPAPGTPGASQQ